MEILAYSRIHFISFIPYEGSLCERQLLYPTELRAHLRQLIIKNLELRINIDKNQNRLLLWRGAAATAFTG
jgi:hypothetical protein